MGWYDRIFGGIFSPVSTADIKSYTYQHNDIKPDITSHNKNTFHQNVNIHTNSSKTQIFSISGSNNQGLVFNDAQLNMTGIFDRPIFFYITQHPTRFYSILLFVFFMIFLIVGLLIYYKNTKKQQRQKQTRLHRQEINDRWPKLDYKGSMSSLMLKIRKSNRYVNIIHLNRKKQPDKDQEIQYEKIIPKTQAYDTLKSVTIPENNISVNIYDEVPKYSITQWAHEEISKHMKL